MHCQAFRVHRRQGLLDAEPGRAPVRAGRQEPELVQAQPVPVPVPRVPERVPEPRVPERVRVSVQQARGPVQADRWAPVLKVPQVFRFGSRRPPLETHKCRY